ncbi:MAG: sensor histidine kinase [Nitrososphaeraceae archaeon]
MSKNNKDIHWSFLSAHAREIGVIATIMITIISFGLFFYQQNISEDSIRKSLFEEHREEQVQSTEIMAERISSDLRLVQSILQGLAGSTYLQQGELSGDRVAKLMMERFEQINNIATVDDLFIADENDVTTSDIVGKGRRSFVDIDISFRDYVPETRERSTAVFSDGFEGIDGIFRIAVTYPIINRDDNRYIGMVGAQIPAVEFFRRYGNVYDIESQYLSVLDSHSVQLVHPVDTFIGTPFFGNVTQEATGYNSILNNLIQSVMSGEPGSAIYEFSNGERLTTGYPILIYGRPEYFNFIITPAEKIFAQVNDVLFAERIKMLSLVGGATAAIIILIIFLIKWNSILNDRVKRRTDELEESNKQLKYHDKLQEEFVNTAAHELRTPIQPILGLSEYLSSRTSDPNQRHLLDVIFRNAKRLQRLSQNILDVSKIEGEKLILRKERFDINDLINSTVQEYRVRMIRRNEDGENNKKEGMQTDEEAQIQIQISFDHKQDVIYVYADKERLYQVITNLLDNSLKFMKSKGGRGEGKRERDDHNNKTNKVPTVLSEKKDDDKVQVSIKDTGPGIDPQVLPRLFSKFASGSNSGTGLGLYICKKIVESHGGSISGKNNSDGIGATFSFSLPLDSQT